MAFLEYDRNISFVAIFLRIGNLMVFIFKYFNFENLPILVVNCFKDGKVLISSRYEDWIILFYNR